MTPSDLHLQAETPLVLKVHNPPRRRNSTVPVIPAQAGIQGSLAKFIWSERRNQKSGVSAPIETGRAMQFRSLDSRLRGNDKFAECGVALGTTKPSGAGMVDTGCADGMQMGTVSEPGMVPCCLRSATVLPKLLCEQVTA